MKKIIFFDGDGTLWAPIHPKYLEPWHIYDDHNANPFTDMQAMPKVFETLQTMGKLGIKRILLSTSPLSPKKAINDRKKMVRSMGLEEVLDEIHFAPEYPEAKGEKMLVLLKAHGLEKSDALMVGDMYKWDYKPAQDVGIDALLVERHYSYKHFENLEGIKTVNNLQDVLDCIN